MSRRTPIEGVERLLDRIESAVGDRNIEERVTESRLLSGVNVDIMDEDGEIVVLADLPGFKKDEMTVQVDDDRLRLLAERVEEDEEQTEYFRRERSRGTVSRTVPLPVAVEADGSEAAYEDGVLTVRLRKAEVDEGEEIEIQ